MGKKDNHSILKTIGIIAAASGTAYASATAFICTHAFYLPKSSLYSGKGGTAFLTFTNNEMRDWYSHSNVQDEYLSSYDGLQLHALKLQNYPQDHKWVILMLGPGAYDHTILSYLYELDHAGYNVLACDVRGTGKSQGLFTSLGWLEHYDVISWVNYLVNLDSESRIALLGVSIGANAVMNAVGDYLPSNVKCAVEEGGFSEIKEVLRHGIQLATKIDGKVFLPGINPVMRFLFGFSMSDVSTAKQLTNACVPMLFVQGVENEFVPESMLFDNYYACGNKKEILMREDTIDDYFPKLIKFINTYI